MKAFMLLFFVALAAVSYSKIVDDTQGYEERSVSSFRCKACKKVISKVISGLVSRKKDVHASAIRTCKKIPMVDKYCDKLGAIALDKGMTAIQKKDRPLYMCQLVKACKK